MLETKPLELIYQGPTNVSQVLSPFSASPPKVLLSGFRSRCHIVIKGAFPTIRVQQGLAQLIQLYTRAGFPNEELQTISETLLTQHQNLQPPCQICTAAAALLWVCLLFLLLSFLFLSFFLLSLLVVFLPCLCCCFFAASWLNFRLPPLFVPISLPMDHAQGRAFHHHLARAIMHLNHLAGLLPFFEPSIEWEDAMPPSHFRLERPASRGLHTFVPLPPASTSPTMVTHGGIPSQLVLNPEPNLRPVTVHPPHHREADPAPGPPVTTRHSSITTDPVADPTPGTTIPVPVRSKQRVSSVEDPQPKKRQKASSIPDARVPATEGCGRPGPLPIISEVPPGGFDSDDSDGDAASRAASAHDHMDHDINYRIPPPPTTTSTTPPGSSTLTLTPNPHAPPPATFRILQPNPPDAPRDPQFRPWTNADDQELMSLKQDTKSRPSWKTIGARLHRDPQVCKLRWGILKQTDQHGRVHPPQEPEAED